MQRPNLTVARDAEAARERRAEEDAALQQAADTALAKSGEAGSGATPIPIADGEDNDAEDEDSTR